MDYIVNRSPTINHYSAVGTLTNMMINYLLPDLTLLTALLRVPVPMREYEYNFKKINNSKCMYETLFVITV